MLQYKIGIIKVPYIRRGIVRDETSITHKTLPWSQPRDTEDVNLTLLRIRAGSLALQFTSLFWESYRGSI